VVSLHLARVALENLWVRKQRTLFLVLSVAVGTGTLALADQQAALIATLPISRLVVRARSGEVTAAQLRELQGMAGVERVEPVAFLFPVILGLTPRSLEIAGVPEKELRREIKIPTTLYGVPDDYVDSSELLPGKRFTGSTPAGPDGTQVVPVPVVLPESLLEFLASLRSEEMVDRFGEIANARLQRAMKRRPKIRENVLRQLGELPGVNMITDAVIKKVIRDGVRTFLEELDAGNLPKSFELALYPGLEEGSIRIPLEVVGFSARTQSSGVAVPIDRLQEWNRRFHEETSGAITRLLTGEPEASYAEVHLHTSGFQASKELRLRLLNAGYDVDSAVEEALAVESELANLGSEAERIAAEAERVDDLSDALGRGAAIFSALLFLLAGTVIVNGLTLSVLEQQKRIGIFRAVGATRLAVIGMIQLEAFVIGALGSALGLVLAAAGLSAAGPRLAAGLSTAAAESAAFTNSGASQAAILGLGVVVSLVAGFLPALKAAAVQPIEVLKH